MNGSLDFAVDRFLSYPFDDRKYHAAAVERGDRQKIEHRQIHADKRGHHQKVIEAAHAYCVRRDGNRGDGAAERTQPQPARQKLSEHGEYRASYAERVFEPVPDGGEKSHANVGRAQTAQAQRGEERVGILNVRKGSAAPQLDFEFHRFPVSDHGTGSRSPPFFLSTARMRSVAI